MAYCEGGTLLSYIERWKSSASNSGVLDASSTNARRAPKLPFPFIKMVLECVSAGMAYLHAFQPLPIIHRDLKSENVLLDDGDKIVLIADLGEARVAEESKSMTMVGTPGECSCTLAFVSACEDFCLVCTRPRPRSRSFSINSLQNLLHHLASQATQRPRSSKGSITARQRTCTRSRSWSPSWHLCSDHFMIW